MKRFGEKLEKVIREQKSLDNYDYAAVAQLRDLMHNALNEVKIALGGKRLRFVCS